MFNLESSHNATNSLAALLSSIEIGLLITKKLKILSLLINCEIFNAMLPPRRGICDLPAPTLKIIIIFLCVFKHAVKRLASRRWLNSWEFFSCLNTQKFVSWSLTRRIERRKIMIKHTDGWFFINQKNSRPSNVNGGGCRAANITSINVNSRGRGIKSFRGRNNKKNRCKISFQLKMLF